MPYIDRNKIDFKLPCYFEDSGEDALVSIRAVKHVIYATPEEDVAPVEEVIAKVREGIRRNTFNPNNKFDFIYDEIYCVLDEVQEEYRGKKSS